MQIKNTLGVYDYKQVAPSAKVHNTTLCVMYLGEDKIIWFHR